MNSIRAAKVPASVFFTHGKTSETGCFPVSAVCGATTVGSFRYKAVEEIRLTKQGDRFTMVVGKQSAGCESKTLKLRRFNGIRFADPWICSKNVEKLEAKGFGQVSILVP